MSRVNVSTPSDAWSLGWLADDPRPLDWNGPTDQPFTPFGADTLDQPIIDHFERVARQHRQRTAIRDTGASLTFGELWNGVAGLAETLAATDIVIGVNAIDYSGYPDCRPEFIAAFERLATLATAAGVSGSRLTIHAPLQSMTKADIIRRGLELGLDYGLTHSCYDPDASGRPCGRCDSCVLRAAGFAAVGVADPAHGR